MLIQGVFDYYTFRAFSCERKDGSLNQINSVFVIGESRTNSDNAITKNYGTFYMAFEVDDLTSEVLDFSCTHTISTTEAFLRKLFVGQVFRRSMCGWRTRSTDDTAARPAGPYLSLTAMRSSAGGQ